MIRGIGAIVIGFGLVVAAGVVVALEPPEEVRQAPLEVAVPLGVDGVGRNIDVTFTDVRLASTLIAEGSVEWTGTTEGTWVVVDLTAAPVVEPAAVHSWLLVDGLLIEGSERADLSGLEGNVIGPGLHTSGVVLFEVPDDVLDSSGARVVVGVNSDWRLDSTIAYTFDLAALTVEDEIVIGNPTVVAQ